MGTVVFIILAAGIYYALYCFNQYYECVERIDRKELQKNIYAQYVEKQRQKWQNKD